MHDVIAVNIHLTVWSGCVYIAKSRDWCFARQKNMEFNGSWMEATVSLLFQVA